MKFKTAVKISNSPLPAMPVIFLLGGAGLFVVGHPIWGSLAFAISFVCYVINNIALHTFRTASEEEKKAVAAELNSESDPYLPETLSTKNIAVLRLLAEHSELDGFEIVRLDVSRALSRSSIYVDLNKLEDDGFVYSRKVQSKHEQLEDTSHSTLSFRLTRQGIILWEMYLTKYPHIVV